MRISTTFTAVLCGAAVILATPVLADDHSSLLEQAANSTWTCDVAQTTDLVQDGEANMLVTMTFSMQPYATSFTGTSQQVLNLDGTDYHVYRAFDGYVFDSGDDDFGLFIQNERVTSTEPQLPDGMYWNSGGTTRLNMRYGDDGWYLEGYADDAGGRVDIDQCGVE